MPQVNKIPKILFLYSHVMGYTYACIKKLVEIYDYEVTLVHYKESIHAPYKLPIQNSFIALTKNTEILTSLENQKYDLVYLPGWFDKDYIKLAKIHKKKGATIVAGSDTQWNGSFKQRIGTLYGRFYLKRFIDYFWVPGMYQYEFIRKFGYQRNKILLQLYCADTELFDNGYLEKREKKNHNLLFVGRFVEAKGITLLVEAFQELKNEINNDWKLIMVGNGPLKSNISCPDIEIIDFQQPEALRKIVSNAGIFVLPSKFEPWGVVVHEFTAAGLPLILSDACGSHVQFLKDSFNGYIFVSGSKVSLKQQMKRLIEKSDEELELMGKRSNEISKSIRPEYWASTINALVLKSNDLKS